MVVATCTVNEDVVVVVGAVVEAEEARAVEAVTEAVV